MSTEYRLVQDAAGNYANKFGVRVSLVECSGGLKFEKLSDAVAHFKLDTFDYGSALMNCRSLRAAALTPRIGDQLDALFHAMEEGLLPAVPAFIDIIKPVKLKFPKPV